MANLSQLGNSLYRGDVSYNIVGRRKVWYLVSAILIALSIATLGVRGLNLGIEFKGGAEFSVPLASANDQSVSQARETVIAAGETPSTVTVVGGKTVRIQTPALTTEASNALSAALAKSFSVEEANIKVQLVGPSWGDEVTQNALRALLVFLILVAIFLSIYFEWPMAVAALIALAHDVLITVGIYALSGFEVTPASVIGFLTILGYSLYDTVVVFDKVKENTKGIHGGSRTTYSESANLALNQTLVRSINTSVVALLPVLSILVVGVSLLGVGTLNDLALALFVGMLVGTYSSIFVATPFLCQIKERTAENIALAKRVQARRKTTNDSEDLKPVVSSGASIMASAGPRQQQVKKSRSRRSGK
jgi:preprotein translocase subunit SecF